MKHFANEDKKPFSELTDEEQACLARACTEDKIQYWNVNEWEYTGILCNSKNIYRTEPNPLKSQIPWDLIDDKFVAFAVDKDMSAWFFTAKPRIKALRNAWLSQDGIHFEAILKLDLNGIDWKESLVMRPGYE